MSCRRFRKTLIDYTDGSLDEARSKSIEKHLASCVGCRSAVEKMSLSRSALSSLITVGMPEEASSRVSSNLMAVARGERKAPAPSQGRLGFLWSPRTLAAAGTGIAILIGIILVVLAYTGPGITDRNEQKGLATGVNTQPVSKGRAPSPATSEKAFTRDVLPSGAAAILPVVKVSQTNYDEKSLKSAFDKMELKKVIARTCTMSHAISMGGLFRRKMADMMVEAGSDGAMLEAMITFLTSSEPVLLPYYAENAQFTGQHVYIIGLAGPRRTGQTTKLNRTEVWVMSPEKFQASPDASIVFFLEEKSE